MVEIFSKTRILFDGLSKAKEDKYEWDIYEDSYWYLITMASTANIHWLEEHLSIIWKSWSQTKKTRILEKIQWIDKIYLDILFLLRKNNSDLRKKQIDSGKEFDTQFLVLKKGKFKKIWFSLILFENI